MSSKKETRTRSWALVVYPESAPENWIQIVESWKIQFAISPLHDADTNGDETEKKEHWHVMLCFDSVKSYSQVHELTRPLNCPVPQRVHSAKGMVRYFLHLDHPNKAQYKREEIRSFGGLDIDDLLRPSSSEKYTLIAEILDFIDDNTITEFTDLMKYARTDRKDDWFPLLCDSNTFLICTYIKSQRHQLEIKSRQKFS